MKSMRLAWYFALPACFAMLLPGPWVQAAEQGEFYSTRLAVPNSAAPIVTVHDVVLDSEGALQGTVVDAQGLAMPATPVIVLQSGKLVAQGQTNDDGRFAIRGLRGGVYQLHAGEGGGTFRLWAHNTAPPAARSAVLLVSDPNVLRGQRPLNQLFTCDALIIGAIIAAAVAIPVAIHNSRSDRDAGS